MISRHHLASALRVLAGLGLLVFSLALWGKPLWLMWGLQGSTITERLGATSLLDRPGAGFMLQITSTPTGATFTVQGKERGTTPAVANVLCSNGEKVVITVRREDFAEYRRQVECREGGQLQVRARLVR